MSRCPICKRYMLKYNLNKYGKCYACHMEDKCGLKPTPKHFIEDEAEK